jgi:hypothetical protein
MTFNDGCGDDYTTTTHIFDIGCPTVSGFAVTPATTVPFTDKQTVRLEALSTLAYPLGYDKASFSTSWVITKAPTDSIYRPYYIEPYQLNTTVEVTNYTQVINSTTKTYYSETREYKWFETAKRTVNLIGLTDNSMSIFPTCFRPDVGGEYIAELTLRLANTQCVDVRTVVVTVDCSSVGFPGGASPNLDKIVDFSFPMSRTNANNIVLNGSVVTDADTDVNDLVFNWKLLYPRSGDRSLVDGLLLPIPSMLNSLSMVASFVAPQAGVTYIVELSVTDHCHTIVKNFTIKTPCEFIPIANKTLAAYYDGSVPVTLMSFAYDHTVEIGSTFTYPRCQDYSWSLVDYSVTYSDSLFITSETEFTKTAGFAGLIASVVIIAIIVPIIIWAYCTKKACFKNTDPRV